MEERTPLFSNYNVHNKCRLDGAKDRVV